MNTKNPNIVFKNKVVVDEYNQRFTEANRLDVEHRKVIKLRTLTEHIARLRNVPLSGEEVEEIVSNMYDLIQVNGIDVFNSDEMDAVLVRIEEGMGKDY